MNGARSLHVTLAVCALAAGCVGSGEVPTRVSGQIVGADDHPLGPGLVLIERGHIHEGSYALGGVIGPDGRFGVALPKGGNWGIHVFADGYSYLPIDLTITDHQQVVLTNTMVAWGNWLDRTGLPTWPDQPEDITLIRMPIDDAPQNDPTIKNIVMTYTSNTVMAISADAADPNGNLSRMILAYDSATGAGYALNPPAPPDAQGNYPNGTYTLTVFLDALDVPGKTQWSFVVSDNACAITPIVHVTMPPRP